jgi:hypothetical protein
MGDKMVAFVGLLVAAQGFWAFLQFVFNRKGRKAEIARQDAAIEKDKDDAETNRLRLLAESREAAQQVALDSWRVAYGRLHEDSDDCERKYRECKIKLAQLCEATSSLVDVFAGFISRMRAAQDADSDMVVMKVSAQEFLSLRSAIAAARDHLP